jgi:CheY-specific phosphatase CheX
MLSGDIQFEGTSMERDAHDANDRVVSFIGLAGTWSGTGNLTCSPAAACRLCSEMLLAEDSSVSEEVLDAIAEVTNDHRPCQKQPGTAFRAIRAQQFRP